MEERVNLSNTKVHLEKGGGGGENKDPNLYLAKK